MTDKEKRIRKFVSATLKVYEDLELARKALKDLYAGGLAAIEEPVAMPEEHNVSLLDEAIGWVMYETLFQERHGAYEEGASGIEWLRTFLEESDA